MPPKITDSRPAADAVVEMEEQTAAGARRIVATYAEDFHDGVTLMSMLGVEPKGFVYKRYNEQRLADEAAAAAPKKATKKTTAKKSTKSTAKKTSTKSTAKKTTSKSTAKKTTAKSTAKKATAKSTAKKTTAKKKTDDNS